MIKLKYFIFIRMRKNKFGNWENQEAFNFLERIWNKGKSVAIFTLYDVYYIEENGIVQDGFKERKNFIVYTQNGGIEETNITTFSQLKNILQNQLIVMLQIEESPQFWLTEWEDLNYRQKTKMVHNVLIPTANVKRIQRRMSERRNKLINMYLEPTQKYHRGGSEYASEDCAICMESMLVNSKLVARLQCGHNYHQNCIKQDTRNICPQCRAPFSFGFSFGKRKNDIILKDILFLKKKIN